MTTTNIQEFHPQIWTFNQPFSRFGLIKVGLTGTVIKFGYNDLFVINPVNTTQDGEAIKKKLDELGKVKWIVCPNMQHHLYAKQYKEWYPDAKVIGMEGLPEKKKDLHFDVVYGQNFDKQKWGFEDDIDSVYFSGFVNKDIAFFHKHSKTLIVADLLANLPATQAYSRAKAGAFSGLPSLSPFSVWQRTFLRAGGFRNKAAMKKDVQKVLDWDFNKIIVGHGNPILENAKDAWKSAYKPYL